MTAPDINTPSPDDGHEALRLAMVAAIGRVEDRAATIWQLMQELQATVGGLAGRVAALEAATTADPDPEV